MLAIHTTVTIHGYNYVLLLLFSLHPFPSPSQPLVKEAEVKWIDMVHQMLSDGHLKFAQLLRNSLVEKVY